jgi:2-polyprenyl-3-methyl-5-hydroxy-6-metoxy-1,4-benzoquinol methylase
MLEIGCASGTYLHKMAKLGWNVKGVEFSEASASAAINLGYDVFCGALEDAPDPYQPFDLLVGWMVLEHLHDPLSCLKKMRRWSKANSWLVLSIPNADSLEFSVFKENWHGLHLPNHTYHYTPETLKTLLFAGGWKLEKVIHQRTMRNLVSSFGYFLKSRGFVSIGDALVKTPAWILFALYPITLLLSLLGQTGRMTIWARPLN